jgi:hypothetical protein
VQYPVVRVVSSLSAPKEPGEVTEETAGRIAALFGDACGGRSCASRSGSDRRSHSGTVAGVEPI